MKIAFCTRCFNESLFAFAVLACASVVSQIPVFAAENEQVYLLQHASETQSSPYALTKLGALAGARKAAAPETGGHILVLTGEGRIQAWGDNRNSQLGIGSSAPQEGWVSVESISDVTAIAAGTSHSVALKEDGSVWTWGANHQGQLGDGTLTNRALPGAVPRLSDVSRIAAGSLFTLALRSDGTVWAFGTNWNDIVPGEARRIIP
jgi:alpha-tubulin suppressor-like RCC1 family protein